MSAANDPSGRVCFRCVNHGVFDACARDKAQTRARLGVADSWADVTIDSFCQEPSVRIMRSSLVWLGPYVRRVVLNYRSDVCVWVIACERDCQVLGVREGVARVYFLSDKGEIGGHDALVVFGETWSQNPSSSMVDSLFAVLSRRDYRVEEWSAA
jgi:hypothetical protein